MVLVNGQAEALIGYPREDLLDEDVGVLVSGRFRDLRKRLKSYLGEQQPRPPAAKLELQGRRRDGSEFPAEISLSSIEVDGSLLVTAAVRDITEWRAAEKKFEQFLEFAPDAILGVMPTGEIVLANQQAEALFGFSRDELIGKLVESLVPERFRGVHPGHRNDYFQEPRTRTLGDGVELYARRRDGTEFPAEISLSSIDTEEGTLAAVAVRDVSDRAEGERERALLEQLHQAQRLESVGQLAGGVAHDFNNILGVIMNYAEFTAEQKPGPQPLQKWRRSVTRRSAPRPDATVPDVQPATRCQPEVLDLRTTSWAGEPPAPGAGRAGRAGDRSRRPDGDQADPG